MRKITKEDCEEIARSHGGKCLAEYSNAHTIIKWACAEGHQWSASYANVSRGSWCPTCAGRPTITLEDCERLAKERGGKCLGAVYINNNTPIVWKCPKGHTWKARLGNVKRGSWCPVCSRGKKNET